MNSQNTLDFNANGYVHLKNFLDLENCQQLTNELKNIVKSGLTTKDDQCPLSEAVHGHEVFDSLLEQLQPYFESVSGKKLNPTYAYARLYANNDELKIHTDRPACEISATLTLGFDGDQWPIYMADDKNKTNQSEILMNIGDAVLYKGMDKYHWRNKFKGKWQAQVFLHYVDADGPHKYQIYDGRKSLAHHKKQDQLYCWTLENAFSVDHCKKIIESCQSPNLHQAEIGDNSNSKIDKTVRDVSKLPVTYHKGVGATLVGIALQANHELWNFDVTHANQSDFLQYDKNGHYKSHVDTFFIKDQSECRKLTALAILNDDFEGGKFYLQLETEKYYPPQKAGTVLIFPSFILHGVEPVTSGIRRTIVTWLVGPWFK